MSLTITVPASVPSDTHSSLPFVPLFSAKKTFDPIAVRRWGNETVEVLMFFVRNVPASVPSDTHSSLSLAPSIPRKKKSEPVEAKTGSSLELGGVSMPPLAPTLTSLTNVVPTSAFATELAVTARVAVATTPSRIPLLLPRERTSRRALKHNSIN